MDGEILLHLYDRFGPQKMASLLDGVFAFILLDTANKKVCVGRDTFGVRPLFKLLGDDGFLGLCSEAKGSVAARRGGTGRDGASCASAVSDSPLLSLKRPDGAGRPGGRPRRHRPLPPGSLRGLRLEAQRQSGVGPDGGVSPLQPGAGPRRLRQRPRAASRYGAASAASPPSPSPPPSHRVLLGFDEETVKSNIRTLFENAVRKRLMAHRRIGCLLSGRRSLQAAAVAAAPC